MRPRKFSSSTALVAGIGYCLVSWLLHGMPVLPHELVRRAVDLSPESLRHHLTPYPDEQRLTLYVLAGYTAVIIALYFTPPVVRLVIHPWVLFMTTLHEFCHAAMVILTGGHVMYIVIDLPGSGATVWLSRGPQSRAQLLVGPVGYLGAGFFGAAFIFAGFSIFASKIASFVIAAIMLLSLIWVEKDCVAVPTILFAIAIMAPLWLLRHAWPLRFYILFVGAVTAVYNFVLMIDTLVRRTIPGSDAHKFAACTCGSARLWGFLWVIICVIFFALAVLAGILVVRHHFNAYIGIKGV